MYSEISVAEKKDKQDSSFDTGTKNDRKKDMACSSCVKHSNDIQKIGLDLGIYSCCQVATQLSYQMVPFDGVRLRLQNFIGPQWSQRHFQVFVAF